MKKFRKNEENFSTRVRASHGISKNRVKTNITLLFSRGQYEYTTADKSNPRRDRFFFAARVGAARNMNRERVGPGKREFHPERILVHTHTRAPAFFISPPFLARHSYELRKVCILSVFAEARAHSACIYGHSMTTWLFCYTCTRVV